MTRPMAAYVDMQDPFVDETITVGSRRANGAIVMHQLKTGSSIREVWRTWSRRSPVVEPGG